MNLRASGPATPRGAVPISPSFLSCGCSSCSQSVCDIRNVVQPDEARSAFALSAPKSPFIAVEALEYAAVEINKTQEAVGQLAGCAAKVICEVVEAVRLSSLQFSPNPGRVPSRACTKASARIAPANARTTSSYGPSLRSGRTPRRRSRKASAWISRRSVSMAVARRSRHNSNARPKTRTPALRQFRRSSQRMIAASNCLVVFSIF